jgi:hypothetical protein
MLPERPEFRYTLEFQKRNPPERLGAVPIMPDWEPLLQWAGFSVLRNDPVRVAIVDIDNIQIEPCWDAQRGRPYITALRAIVHQDVGDPIMYEVPLNYFHSLAQEASSEFVKCGKLAAGEIFEYSVCAYPQQIVKQKPASDSRFSVTPVAETLAIDERSLDEFLPAVFANAYIHTEQLPVFLPKFVLEEAAELLAKAGAVETGGILIGHLHRDSRLQEVFLEVTAQIPARHAQQELTRLAFTPDTWSAVDAALTLRGQGEVYVGWWHTHPAGHWCDACPPETKQRCNMAGRLSGDFFSNYDLALHRAVFPSAYSVALVISDSCQTPGNPAWQLYGWHYGMMMPREFHILNADDRTAANSALLPHIGETHVQDI